MGPRRKRQRLSEDGAAVVTATATADAEQAPNSPQASTKDEHRKQLFVRSLAPSVTTQDLTDYFSDSFPIKHALVVLDRETKASKGYGFVTFADAEDAQRAKEELDGSELQGKKIKIDIAESRHRDADTDVPSAVAKAKAEREQQRKENLPPKLIIRNLPWSIRYPAQLEKLFKSYGKVHFANLPKKHTGELRGFGIVGLRGQQNAEKAIAELNGKEINGRPIAVDWAVDRDTWQTMQKPAREEAEEDKEEDDSNDVSDDSDEPSSEEPSEDEDSDDEEGEDDSNTDYEDVSDSDEDGGIQLDDEKPKRSENTVFIRNLPFTADDDSLFEHFTQFGHIRYARIVLDRETERPKGTGFVCFAKEEDMIECLKGVPRVKLFQKTTDQKDGSSITVTHSILEDEEADPTGKYTMDGRILRISQAVDRNEATRLTEEGAATRFSRDKDKRRLYLLSEGTIPSNSPLYQKLAPSEIKMREESTKLRRKQIQENPSLHLSFTRLSVRNIPRSITSKDLKALARKAVVGFAEDVKYGNRQKLSKEEIARGGAAMMQAEKIRKKRGKGIVRQAKVVFESDKGSKVAEDTGAGRSRGYGFIEYYTHRNALMGLRWLNGHAVDYKVKGEAPKGKKAAQEALQDKKKRLIVEFAIENANVVLRRSDRETKSRENPKTRPDLDENAGDSDGKVGRASHDSGRDKSRGNKRKRNSEDTSTHSGVPLSKRKDGRDKKNRASGADAGIDADTVGKADKLAQRTRIIAKKRQMRRAKRAGKT